jgi:hypothetical protein
LHRKLFIYLEVQTQDFKRSTNKLHPQLWKAYYRELFSPARNKRGFLLDLYCENLESLLELSPLNYGAPQEIPHSGATPSSNSSKSSFEHYS